MLLTRDNLDAQTAMLDRLFSGHRVKHESLAFVVTEVRDQVDQVVAEIEKARTNQRAGDLKKG